MPRRILYLGLDPPDTDCIHYPVIRTQKIDDGARALALWDRFSHVIFTSKTAVRYWFEIKPDFDKSAIAIGEATANALLERGVKPLIASVATQEGVIALLKTLSFKDAYLFLPRSQRARSALTDFLTANKIDHFPLDLYDTVFQKMEPVPDLSEIDEIVFTSPSTVTGFILIYGQIPKDKVLTTIGPITERFLEANKS